MDKALLDVNMIEHLENYEPVKMKFGEWLKLLHNGCRGHHWIDVRFYRKDIGILKNNNDITSYNLYMMVYLDKYTLKIKEHTWHKILMNNLKYTFGIELTIEKLLDSYIYEIKDTNEYYTVYLEV